MSIATLAWKLASPYDAYVSHVSRLEDAIQRIRYFSGRALAYNAGIQSSGRIATSESDPAARAQRIRGQLSTAASEMTDEQFEEFIAHLGGGDVADVESDQARMVSRMSHVASGLEEYFGVAGRELATLEARGYNPQRRDVARQLRENRLPTTTLAEYRHELRELGTHVGQASS